MKMYQGLACAVYGSKSGRFTLTELAGTRKDDIQVVKTETREFYPHSPSKKFIEGAFGNVIKTARILSERSPDTTLPIIIGTESDFNVTGILTGLCAAYPDVILRDSANGQVHDNGYPLSLFTKAIDRFSADKLWALFGDGFYSTLKEGIKDKSNVYIAQHRGYDCVRKQVTENASCGKVAINGVDLYPVEFRSSLDDLLTRWESGEKAVQPALLEKAKELAGISSAIYQLRQQLMGATWIGPRFFDAPEDLRSRLYVVPDARKVFGEEFMHLLGITYNICVKGNRDKSSPPYGDVTAATMADYMDKDTGDKPGVVLVNHANAAA